jgi:hypothetical protein
LKEKIKAAFLSMKRFEAIEAVKEAIRSGEDSFARRFLCDPKSMQGGHGGGRKAV